VYGAARAGARPRPSPRLPRLPGAGAARALALGGGLWAIVATVPQEAGWQARLEEPGDLDWLATCGEAHHAVISAVSARMPVVPFRMFALFRSDERAARTLARSAAALRRTLARLAGRREWVLRVAAVEPPRREVETRLARSGSDYLRRKAADDRRARRALPRAARLSGRIAARLEQLADARVRRPVHDTPGLLIESAMLVPRSREAVLRAMLERERPVLTEAGCRASLSGPWPPYSFAAPPRGRA
jgi:hypothetical protein